MKSAFDYIYLRQKGKIEFFMAALGMASVKGIPEHFELKIKRIVKESVTLTGTGRDYGDLGDGIINTLTGDLEIKSGKKIIARAQGTAGLERRVPNQF